VWRGLHLTNLLVGGAALLAAAGGVGAAVNRLVARHRRARRAEELLWGTPGDENRGIKRTPGLLERLQSELLPNGGHSLVDKVSATHHEVLGLRRRLDEHLEEHERHPWRRRTSGLS
jgi:hypothetical protein